MSRVDDFIRRSEGNEVDIEKYSNVPFQKFKTGLSQRNNVQIFTDVELNSGKYLLLKSSPPVLTSPTLRRGTV